MIEQILQKHWTDVIDDIGNTVWIPRIIDVDESAAGIQLDNEGVYVGVVKRVSGNLLNELGKTVDLKNVPNDWKQDYDVYISRGFQKVYPNKLLQLLTANLAD